MSITLTSVRAGRRLFREEDAVAHEQKPEQRLIESSHQTVFPFEAVALLALKKGDLVLDATAGQGGHSERILKAAPVSLIALDADPQAVRDTRKRLSRFGDRVRVVEANFGDLSAVLKKLNESTIDKALFDLGWNRGQLFSGRGFSFLRDEPLNMSYGRHPASGFTVAEALNMWSEKTLADVFFGYGEERYARRIAKKIVETRTKEPFVLTNQLVEVIVGAVPPAYRRGRIHPATRTFQALRIAVNDEMGVLNRGLQSAWKHMHPGGRIAVITFHSVEDRAVKKLFQTFSMQGGKRIAKKPLVPAKEELEANPSARSAKMRVIEKI